MLDFFYKHKLKSKSQFNKVFWSFFLNFSTINWRKEYNDVFLRKEIRKIFKWLNVNKKKKIR